jgi:hypothetical protein
LTAWRDALLNEIARGRCVSSRGRFNPRGVKRKMSNFKVRRPQAAHGDRCLPLQHRVPGIQETGTNGR